ncbi:MAG: desulfoferrodoxin family protein [Atopobiaceae bacterium]
MEELKAGSTDAAQEKHVPALSLDGHKLTVTVGSVEHPMTEEHYIEWIAVVADDRLNVRYLKPGDKPTISQCINGAANVSVYAYCNLHGLWKADLEA